ncbi:MAG: fructose-bisphosphatase class II [Cryobacterium sp.]|nr:fructose-bisphosphatase class II [Cryobacterium sp.]
MFDPVGVFYLEKLIAGAAGHGVVDLRVSATHNLRAFPAASGIPGTAPTVAVLDKPGHAGLIRELELAGA